MSAIIKSGAMLGLTSILLSATAFGAIPTPGVPRGEIHEPRAGNPAAFQKSLADLARALRGEANASHRYQLFAKQADLEGYQQIAGIFRAAAQSEAIHANNHWAAIVRLGGTVPEVTLDPVDVRSTRENLAQPIRAERDESKDSYPQFIRDAEKERATIAIQSFTFAKNAEAQHLKLFEEALKKLGNNPSQDFYVQRKTGATYAIPKGTRFAGAGSPSDYIKIG